MSATFTVVTLDGQEHANLDQETVKEWFLRKRLREDSFVMSSETGEWKLLKKVFNVSLWLSQNFGQAQYPPQPLFPQQQQMPQAVMPQQQIYQQPAYTQQAQQQQNYSPPMPQQSIYDQHAMQNNYYPAQPEVNAQWQQQQYQQTYQQQYQQPQYQQPQYQPQPLPQTQWVSQQNWVAPPPPVQSFAQRVAGVFESATGRAKATTICLRISMAILGVNALINAGTIVSPPDLQAIAQGQFTPGAAMLLMFAGLVTLLHLGVLLVTGILFLMWLYRAYKNLHAFGMATEVSPGWVVGYWFIPIVNLFRPYQRVNELLEKSITVATRFRCNTNIVEPSKVGAWWACYLISGLIGRGADRLSLSADSTETLVFASVLDLASCILAILAAWLIITIIQSIDEMHESSISAVSRNPFMQ